MIKGRPPHADVFVVLQLMVIIGLTHVIVVFRVVAAPLMSDSEWKFLQENANHVAVLLGAVLHYVTIQVMTRVGIPQKWQKLG